jgi:hypothetical protein
MLMALIVRLSYKVGENYQQKIKLEASVKNRDKSQKRGSVFVVSVGSPPQNSYLQQVFSFQFLVTCTIATNNLLAAIAPNYK